MTGRVNSNRQPLPSLYRLPEGVAPSAACEHYATILEKTLRERHHEVAAVVMEPLVQCAAGIVTHPPGFLRARESWRFSAFLQPALSAQPLS